MRQHRDLALIQLQVIGAEKAILCHADRRGAAQKDRIEHGSKFRLHRVFGDHFVDQADALRLTRVEALASESVAASVTQADGIDHVGSCLLYTSYAADEED